MSYRGVVVNFPWSSLLKRVNTACTLLCFVARSNDFLLIFVNVLKVTILIINKEYLNQFIKLKHYINEQISLDKICGNIGTTLSTTYTDVERLYASLSNGVLACT